MLLDDLFIVQIERLENELKREVDKRNICIFILSLSIMLNFVMCTIFMYLQAKG